MTRSADSRELTGHARQGPIALRQRGRRHSMAMVVVLVAVALAAAALLSPLRALPGPGNSGFRHDSDSSKTSRLAAISDTDIACRGQAWGAESETCLQVISRASGKGKSVRIRLIGAGAPASTTPNLL